MTPTIRTTSTLALLVAATALTGCWGPGGSMRSEDVFMYPSTSYEPATIELVDGRNGQVIWSYDVPVDRTLTIAFYENDGDKTKGVPDQMTFSLGDRGSGAWYPRGNDELGRINVPAAPYRRVDYKLRAAPELPASMTPGSDIPKPPQELIPKSDEPAPAAPVDEKPAPAPAPSPKDHAEPSAPPSNEPGKPPVDLNIK